MNTSKARRRVAAAASMTMLATTALAGCGSGGSGGTPTLTWYINPDGGGSTATAKAGGQAWLAKLCSDQSGGKYKINVQLLPNSASDQQVQLLRRLSASDPSMDLMSVDPAFITQFAAAGYLAPVPSNMTNQFTNNIVASSVKASTYKGKLIAVPFWANTQVLWYRKSVAKKAGLDMTKPVTWDQLIAAAQKTKTNIGVQAAQYEGYSVWINALMAGAGGKIVENPDAEYDKVKLGLDSDAGRKTAAIISKIANSGVGGPAVGSSMETQSVNLFAANGSSGFLVNWPYVYNALGPGATSLNVPWRDSDLGFTRYPQTVAGKASTPPFGGIELAVGKSSKHANLAYQAAACIANEKNQASYMVATGNPASNKLSYNEDSVKKAFPKGLAALIAQSLDAAAPRPLSPYWGDISSALQQEFSSPNSVNSGTPAKAQKFIKNVLNGKALL